MLKKRVIVLLTLYDGVLTRTKQFQPDYRYTLSHVGLDCDELMILDITPEGEGDRANFWTAARPIVDSAFVPVAIGGKIRTLDDVRRAMDFGADKVVIRYARSLIPLAAAKLGSQSVVGSLDDDSNKWTALCAERMVFDGAGEILIQSVPRDGSLEGYDIPLLKRVVSRVNVPVVIGGGCGSWFHMKQAFEAGASGAATNNIMHFNPTAMTACKQYLDNNGVAVRT